MFSRMRLRGVFLAWKSLFTRVLILDYAPACLENERRFTSTALGALAGVSLVLSIVADPLGGIATDRLAKRYGLKPGRCGPGGIELLIAGTSLISDAAVQSALVSTMMISVAGLQLTFFWGCVVGSSYRYCRQPGVVSA